MKMKMKIEHNLVIRESPKHGNQLKMIRKCVRFGRFSFLLGGFILVNTLFLITYHETMYKYSKSQSNLLLNPSMKTFLCEDKTPRVCEREQFVILQNSLSNILSIKSELTQQKYETLSQIRNIVNGLYTSAAPSNLPDHPRNLTSMNVRRTSEYKLPLEGSAFLQKDTNDPQKRKSTTSIEHKTIPPKARKILIANPTISLKRTTVPSTIKTELPQKKMITRKKTIVHLEKPVTYQPRSLIYSCPETYNGSTFGYPYFTTGYVRTKCKRPSIQQSTTLILQNPVIEPTTLESILRYASKTFNQIYLIVDEMYRDIVAKVISVLPDPDIRIYLVFTRDDNGVTVGKALNQVTQMVRTHFILVAPNLGKLDNSSDVERLINVHEMSGVNIVGSAVKNVVTGAWDRGCYQYEKKMFILRYFPGYHSSKHECLYCGRIVSPFLVKTAFLKQILFSELNAGVYEDLFLRLEERQILSCPDVLFYTNPENSTDQELAEFADKWKVSKIVDGHNVRWFGHRKGFSHTKSTACDIYDTLAVPLGCRANLLDAIHFIMTSCEENDIKCELQEGSLIGAVKFHHILPWERDADITVLSKDFRRFTDLKVSFKANGYLLQVVHDSACCFEGVMTGGVAKVHANGWIIEIYGQHKLTTPLNGTRTKLYMGNRWVYTPENPGLYVRNRYGKEIYRHAEHWFSTKKESGWDLYDSGSFLKCRYKGHHSCLDQFKGDGDLQFLSWL